jgi:hypothetical protein
MPGLIFMVSCVSQNALTAFPLRATPVLATMVDSNGAMALGKLRCSVAFGGYLHQTALTPLTR